MSSRKTSFGLRPGLTLTASLLALVVVAVLALLYNNESQSGTKTTVVPSVPPNPSSTAVANPPRSPAFGLPTTDLFGVRLETPTDPAGAALPQDSAGPDPGLGAAWFIAAPAGMMWQRGWNGAALPASRSDGPARIDGGIASGFAHTPQGAGLAAADAMARALAAPDGVWQRVVAARFVGDQAALLERYASSRRDNPDAAKYVVVPAGIKVVGYRDDFAVVQLGVRTPQGKSGFSSWPMVWVDGDWRIRAPEDVGALWAASTLVTSLADFGVWR
ncbi:hypothetical protein OG874_35785 [Nocardia sp. NBC_00565]|uniref:hypothetical protein n=1 Tax=Nocardia sp. NBC_00565 TaxID=2975993 RepID=UPI002E8204BB|nr:hypothetical protein [Nocardia sp. NBC_00565]WUC02053.1 hypothetical protein OG874_35785 [Nocardia sp. NBC_00565]